MPMRRRFAIHETGKALVASLLRRADIAAGQRPQLERIERVSMIPRGRYAALSFWSGSAGLSLRRA